jgi:hypothetical protein
MKTLINYLDDLKDKTGSDYKTAILLNTTDSNISTIRKRGRCSDEMAIKIANLLEVSHEDLLVAAAIARSNDIVKAAWENISRKAGLSMNAYMAIGHGYPALKSGVTAGFESIKCILCQIVKESIFANFVKKTKRNNHDILRIEKRSRTRRKSERQIIQVREQNPLI